MSDIDTGTDEEFEAVKPTELMRRQAACDEIEMYADEATDNESMVDPKDIYYALYENGLRENQS